MFIKKTTKKKTFSFSLFTKIYFYFSIIILALILLFISQTGVWENNKKNFLNRIYFNGIDNYLKIFNILNTAKKKFSFTYKEIEINIPYENVLVIEKNRQELIDSAIQGGSKRNQSVDFITTSADIQSDDKNYRISIRLKGDRTLHFREKENSSYKIEIRGDERLFGMKKFSFIKPRLRNYIHEWLFHELSSEKDLIKLNYEFVYLSINGSKQGLYVLEENFGKELIERNKRRNGPIFSLLSEYDWNIYDSKFEVYNKEYWSRPDNLELVDFAKKKIKNFLDGNIKINDVFDLKKWAWFFATTDLTYTFHGIDPNNVKMYYNPVNGLIEPIPYDGHRVKKNFNENLINFESKTNFEMAQDCFNNVRICEKNDPENFWKYNLFYNKDRTLNKAFYKEYIEALREISDETFIRNFFSKREKDISRINAAIYSDYFFIDNLPYDKYGPGLYYFSKEDIYFRAKILREKIEPLLNKIYVSDNIKFLTIENNSLINHQLKISKIICNKFNAKNVNTFNQKIDEFIDFKEKITIKKNSNLKNTKCDTAEFSDANGKVFFKKIIFSPNINFSNKWNNNYLKYFQSKNKKLTLINSETRINENIFIPSGHLIEIKSNEKIILTDNAFIYSKSPWKVGDNKGEVQITGEPGNFGGGIFILDSKIKSNFINTKFSYLSGLEKNQFFNENFEHSIQLNTKYFENQSNKFTYYKKKLKKKNYEFLDGKILYGALNFYNTNALIQNSEFFRIDSEDALNFISSIYNIERVSFNEVSGDAIDIDFGSGQIHNSEFINIGNDGIDLSGTFSKLKNLKFTNISDKIISVGENTEAQITNLSGRFAFVGVASKDGSKTFIKNINLDNVDIPFASYIKKKSYEAGFISVSGTRVIQKYDIIAIKDKNSKILIDGKLNDNIENEIIDKIYNRELL